MLCNRAKEKNLEFHVDVSPELPVELFGDEVRIKQILINVLNNAIKYTDKGAVQLAVSCERDETDTAFIFFTVKDTGIGIKKRVSHICLQHSSDWMKRKINILKEPDWDFPLSRKW